MDKTPYQENRIEPTSTYFVSTEGNDSNLGTLAFPWKTIQKAVDKVNPGETVIVRGGVYKEKVTIKTSGQPNAHITLKNYWSETPVIDGADFTPGRDDSLNALILIKNKNYIRIEGFDITGYISHNNCVPAGIMVRGTSSFVEILRCRVYGIKTTYPELFTNNRNAHAIAVYGDNSDKSIDSLVIDGCEVYDNVLGQSEAVVLNGNVTNFKVINNKVHDNDNIGIDFIGFENVASSDDQARNGICSGNLVWNISCKNNRTYKHECADGIYIDGGKDIVVERNIIWNCDIGIEVASEHKIGFTDNIIVRSNLVYNCKAVAGITFGGYAKSKGRATSIRIYNNTLYDNVVNVMIQHNCQHDSNIIKNNIIYKGVPFSGSKKSIIISNNVTDNPSFKDESEYDFHVTECSSAINAGVNDFYIGTLDLDGNQRTMGGTVDCGAYEKM